MLHGWHSHSWNLHYPVFRRFFLLTSLSVWFMMLFLEQALKPQRNWGFPLLPSCMASHSSCASVWKTACGIHQQVTPALCWSRCLHKASEANPSVSCPRPFIMSMVQTSPISRTTLACLNLKNNHLLPEPYCAPSRYVPMQVAGVQDQSELPCKVPHGDSNLFTHGCCYSQMLRVENIWMGKEWAFMMPYESQPTGQGVWSSLSFPAKHESLGSHPAAISACWIVSSCIAHPTHLF